MSSQDKRGFCTVRVGHLTFGIEIAQVQEVLRPQHMTSVPLAPDIVAGLINLRGLIVAAVNLRRRLGLPALYGQRPSMNVVVRGSDGPISLLVDEIGDVVEIGDEALEPPPETLRGPARDVIRGVYKLDHGLLLWLDLERALEHVANTPGIDGAHREVAAAV